MKKVLALPLMLMILFSGIVINYSAHLCGGNVVATRFSLNGEIALCNMEKPYVNQIGLDLLKTHCCDNIAASFQLKTNYIPSTTTIDNTISPTKQISFTPYIIPDASELFIIQTIINSKPPGKISSDLHSPVSLHKLLI